MSCRFLLLSYDNSAAASPTCFEDAFLPDITGQADDDSNNSKPSYSTCDVGIGLYQWLRQSSSNADNSSWSNGGCVGYQESMLSRINDTSFSLARGFGVFAVLMSFVVLLWNLLLACIELNYLQVVLRRLCSLLLVMSCGMSFLLERSDVCASQFPSSTCKLEQGAMAMIAACILWLCDLIICGVWLRSPGGGFKLGMRRGRDDSTDRDEDDEEQARAAAETARNRYARAVQVFHPNDSHLQRISPSASADVRASRPSSPNQQSQSSTARDRDATARSSRTLPSPISSCFSYSVRSPDDSAGASPPSVSKRGRRSRVFQDEEEGEVSNQRKEDGETVGAAAASESRRTVTVDDAASKDQLEVILDNIERHIRS
jgi:hypothetical protein